MTFQSCRGKPVQQYGGKALLTLNGKPLFAELVVLRMLEKDGWRGVWVDSYGRQNRVGMPHTTEPIDLPPAEEEFLNRLRDQAGCRGGCFDVFAWRGRECRFIELKRRGKDRIRDTQKRWLAAAIRSGIKMSNLLIIEWTS